MGHRYRYRCYVLLADERELVYTAGKLCAGAIGRDSKHIVI